ncbi:MAG TPA: polysaccharide biosynthesis/export family protein [Aestuariivirgaceae bacterium]|nr:polysaccharide biosynthesis/export family protein [Aestuariivirgaceae bacterium]
MRSWGFLFALGLGLALSACRGDWEMSRRQPSTSDLVTMGHGSGRQALRPVADRAASPPYGYAGVPTAYEADGGYRIGAGDKILVSVMGETDLSGEHLVDASGKIILPFVGQVTLAGLTSNEASRMIASGLRRGYLRQPQVSVQVVAMRPVYIAGEVAQAGAYAYQPGMTVQNAVAIAGGYGARADHGVALLTRKSPQGTRSFRVPLTAQLYPGDILFIRERWF